jgi:hypothetical protein
MRNNISTSILEIHSSENNQTENQCFQGVDAQRWESFLYGITGHAISVLSQSGCDPQAEMARLRVLREQYSILDLFSFSKKEAKRVFKIISVIWQFYGLFLQLMKRDINNLTSQEIRDFSDAKLQLRNRLWGLIPEPIGDYVREAIRRELEEDASRSFPCDYENQAEYLSQYGYEISY